MRDACTNSRDLAIIDMLVSTGMRVEMVTLKEDVNFQERECVVLGKGDKQEYFDARTKFICRGIWHRTDEIIHFYLFKIRINL